MIALKEAKAIIAAAEAQAAMIRRPMNIALADGDENLVAHLRMDGAWIGSIDISTKKAYTQRDFDIGKIMIFAGGVPVRHDGKVVGAIGVTGGSGEQEVAEEVRPPIVPDKLRKTYRRKRA